MSCALGPVGGSNIGFCFRSACSALWRGTGWAFQTICPTPWSLFRNQVFFLSTNVIRSLKKYLNGSQPRIPLSTDVSRTLVEFDIDTAIAAHQNWKFRLLAYLNNESSEDMAPEVICFDDRCDLGRWIHGSGKAHLGQFPGFTALMGHHKMFHYAASNVVALSKAGRDVQSQKMMAEQFTAYSKAVVEDLERMRRAAVRARKSMV